MPLLYIPRLKKRKRAKIGKIDKTRDLYFEEYDEWKLNRGLQDE